MRSVLFGLPLLAVLAAPAWAEEPTCHSVAGYDVLEVENTEGIGTRFAVKAGTNGSAAAGCKFKEAEADFVVGSEDDPFHFEAITDRYLIMRRSWGPQGQLVIYDLDARDIVLDALSDEAVIDATGATFWERIDEGTPANCPQFEEYKADGFGADIAVETRFDFATATATASNNTRCDPSQ
ncbi:hypothetical protein [Tianweitania sediminis]|uniref:Uncharacterized protein n=1 Tax=Tianweitania sediminis TaxID=1502156 RepID=A0A8J7R0N9_9HYPH|nr:hypothetical protein [Tianweitania sediminis]MBP0439790.1 hypothetical protein [Tianweitania sediminis]